MRPWVRPLLGCAIAAAVGSASGSILPAQGAINTAGACPNCLSIRRLRTVGDTSGPGEMPDYIRSVVSDTRGNLFIAGLKPNLPLYYSDQGQFAGTIGRPGRGPGELIAGIVVGVAGDTIWVLDGMNGRVTGFSRSSRVLASWSTPGTSSLLSAVRTRDGSIAANSFVHNATEAGIPLFLLEPNGRRRPLADAVTAMIMNQPRLVQRTLAAARDHGFWAGHFDRYRIERFDSSGRRSRVLDAPRDWFPEGDGTMYMLTPRTPPKPTIVAIAESSGGLLWVLITVPDPAFAEGLRKRPGVQSAFEFEWEIVDFDRYFDTIVEVIDPVRGTLLASQRFDPMLQFALTASDGRLMAASSQQMETGHQRLVLSELTLRLKPGSKEERR